MQDPLLQMVLPHLGPGILAHLRASCRHLHTLIDSQLCADIWLQAAHDLLPSLRSCQMPKLNAQHSLLLCNEQHQQQQQQAFAQAFSDQQEGVNQRQGSQQGTAGAEQAHEMLPAAALDVQRLLREHASVKKGLSQTASIAHLPWRGNLLSKLWSPCGTWVALQTEQSAIHQDNLAPSVLTLEIWNTATGAARELMKVIRNLRPYRRPDLVTMAWLPNSSWLLWTRSVPDSTNAKLLFCENAASGQRHELLYRPFPKWSHLDEFSIAATGRLLAYACARGSCVMLISLPHLKQGAILSAPCNKESTQYKLAMRFNPAGTWIAICWVWWDPVAGTAHHVHAFCVDVFNTRTYARAFSLPLKNWSSFAWSPFSPHLLITTDSMTHMLDVSKLESSDALDAPGMPAFVPDVCLTWLADGSLAVHAQSASCMKDDALQLQKCDVVLPGYAPTSQTKLALPDLKHASGHILSPLQKMLSNLHLAHICLPDMLAPSDTHEILKACSVNPGPFQTVNLSPCHRLAVIVSEYLTWRGLRHFDIDLAAGSSREHCMPVTSPQGSSSPVWHPSPVASRSRIYALAGRGYDLWLLDGRQHRVLQHWRGKDFVKQGLMGKLVGWIDRQPGCMYASWEEISWSEDGTRLLLKSDAALFSIDFSPWNEGKTSWSTWSQVSSYMNRMFGRY